MQGLIDRALTSAKEQEAVMAECIRVAEEVINSLPDEKMRSELSDILGSARAGKLTPSEVAGKIRALCPL